MYVLKDSQQVDLSVTVTDRRGNPATVQNPSWSSSDDSVVVVADSGMSAVATAAGPLGSVTVTFTGDADLGEGVSPITGVLDVDVVAGDAAMVNITAGEPTEQAAVEAPSDSPVDPGGPPNIEPSV